MCSDRVHIQAHKDWIGLLQPVGLVVAPPALITHGVVLNTNARDIADLQARLAQHVGDTKPPAVTELATMLKSLLDWQDGDIISTPEVLEALTLSLPEFGTTLAPTHAVPNPSGGWQLLIREEPIGTDLDAPPHDDGHGWVASPQTRFERLLREAGVGTGLLANGTIIRLVHAPRGETSGHVTFPIANMLSIWDRPILAAFHMLLNAERLFGAPDDNLGVLLADSRRYQAEVSEALSAQVLGALYELLRGLSDADARTNATRMADLAHTQPDHVYGGLLTTLMRLVFILYGEDRGLFPNHEVWQQNYALAGLFERLRDDAARYPDTMDSRYGAWAQLLAVFRIVHGGAQHGTLKLPARRGDLFDPDRFPFLEGRDTAADKPSPPHVADGVVWRMLSRLMVLKGERLSYRTLDVEQLGSVYETMMGFTVQLTTGPSLAIKPDESGGAATIVNLEALLAIPPGKRAGWLKEHADRKVSAVQLRTLTTAETVPALAAALERIQDRDASPAILQTGVPVLQPTEARRKSGSHYTPRSLTAPIVETALKPHFLRLGDNAAPEAILGLRVLDPAMGSGAFLVEACRQLADALVLTWQLHRSTPALAPDEDATIHARRLVAQRCLYGVDRNRMAVDLARVSLWLATLARDHEFTFLDHALRWGDSLLGLSLSRIADLSWTTTAHPGLATSLLRGPIARAEVERRRIREALEGEGEEVLRPVLRQADAILDPVRRIGDAVCAAFFSETTARTRQGAQGRLADDYMAAGARWQAALTTGQAMATLLAELGHTFRPFHWPIEFPEVFASDDPGFDVVVGNPPFAGKNTIQAGNPPGYLQWLQALHPGAHGNSDLCAHFFRRAGSLLRRHGTFGLIATNTIRQGDTRESGLRALLDQGFTIYAATRRLTWPGKAAVVVSVVHMARGVVPIPAALDGRGVSRISAFLVNGTRDASPTVLRANAGLAFQGSILLGMGFTFDDDTNEPSANRLAVSEKLIFEDPRNAERIRPYIGGEEVNESPTHAHRRCAIDFFDFPLARSKLTPSWEDADETYRSAYRSRGMVPLDYPEPVASDWPALLQIVQERVKPERDPQRREALRERWWQYAEKRPGLYAAIRGLRCVLVIVQTSKHLCVTFLQSGCIYDQKLIVFSMSSFKEFALLQSQPHEIWARFFGSTMEDRPVYTPSDGFQTFPFPNIKTATSSLEDVGKSYFEYRAALMVKQNIGLTQVYNCFADPNDQSPDINHLRNLHSAMDAAVLRAYGWPHKIPTPIHEREWPSAPGENLAPWRRRWPEAEREAVLEFLWDLNRRRAEEEAAEATVSARAGPTPPRARRGRPRATTQISLLDI